MIFPYFKIKVILKTKFVLEDAIKYTVLLVYVKKKMKGKSELRFHFKEINVGEMNFLLLILKNILSYV